MLMQRAILNLDNKSLSSALRLIRPVLVGLTLMVAPAQASDEISLIDHNGRTVALSELKVKPSVVMFGFMNCPAICPATLYHAANALQKLGPDGDKLQVLFVTVDPERDTPENLAGYVSAFDDRIVGLTGTDENIASFAANLGARYRRVPGEQGDYTMSHSVHSFLLGTGWRTKSTVYFGPEADPLSVRDKLRRLVAAKPNL